MCAAATEPTTPLWTETVGCVAAAPEAIIPLIGPIIWPFTLVLRPTSTTFMYSSSILSKSLGWIDEIPLKLNVEIPAVIPPLLCLRIWLIGVNEIGCWTIPSRLITVFDNFLVNSNSWALPSPGSVNVTKIPDLA